MKLVAVISFLDNFKFLYSNILWNINYTLELHDSYVHLGWNTSATEVDNAQQVSDSRERWWIKFSC